MSDGKAFANALWLHAGRRSGRIPHSPLAGVGVSRTATLQVKCALGKVPEEHPSEGIGLAFEGGGVEFAEEVSGRTLLLLTGPGAGAPAKAPALETETNPASAGVPG